MNSIRKYAPELTLLLLAFVIAAFMAWIAPAAWATQPDPEHKVGICHRTASDTNPYVYIEVDEAAVPAHIGNTLPGHKPTVWKTDGTWRGVDHVAGDPKDDYLAQTREDCDDIVVEPTPTPTPTVTPTPTPTDTPTVKPTPSDTPTTHEPKPTPDKPDKTPDVDKPEGKTPDTLPKTGAALELLAWAGGAIAIGAGLYLLAKRAA